jgi:hypothetical protein
VILGDPPSIDISPMEDSSAVEIAAASCQTPSALVVGDLPSSDRADRCDRLPVSDESPVESAVAPNDPEDELAWITLDTDAEPVWLAERFDALSSPYEEAMYAELAARLGAMQGLAMDATESERTSPVWPGASSANSGSPASVSNLESERRDWTTAGIVRYPLHFPNAAMRPGIPDGVAPLSPALASSAGFVDIGRLVSPIRTLRQPAAAFPEPAEIARRDALTPSLTPDPLAANTGRSKAPLPSRTSALTTRSLVGESRSQRLMLLASTGPRPSQPNEVSPLPLPTIERETPQVRSDRKIPPRAIEEPKKDGQEAVSRPNARGTLPGNSQTTAPPADDRVSRSTMDGIAAVAIWAAGLLSKVRKSQDGNSHFSNDA